MELDKEDVELNDDYVDKLEAHNNRLKKIIIMSEDPNYTDDIISDLEKEFDNFNSDLNNKGVK